MKRQQEIEKSTYCAPRTRAVVVRMSHPVLENSNPYGDAGVAGSYDSSNDDENYGSF